MSTTTLATFRRPHDPDLRVQIVRRGRSGRELFDVLVRARVVPPGRGSVLGFAVEAQAVDYALTVVTGRSAGSPF